MLAHSADVALAVNEVEALYRLGRWQEAAQTLRRLDRHHGPALRVQLMIWRVALPAARGTGPEPDPEALAVPLGGGLPQTALPLAQMITSGGRRRTTGRPRAPPWTRCCAIRGSPPSPASCGRCWRAPPAPAARASPRSRTLPPGCPPRRPWRRRTGRRSPR
ncbi:hypothetical protein [Actinomadura chokoriensis]|uniref:hypothetical protein n=1 Tax=Actinomadura chokoriensis TaxID=454156 RepID=UPI0031FA175E